MLKVKEAFSCILLVRKGMNNKTKANWAFQYFISSLTAITTVFSLSCFLSINKFSVETFSVNILSVGTDRHEQTGQTQIRLLSESDLLPSLICSWVWSGTTLFAIPPCSWDIVHTRNWNFTLMPTGCAPKNKMSPSVGGHNYSNNFECPNI